MVLMEKEKDYSVIDNDNGNNADVVFNDNGNGDIINTSNVLSSQGLSERPRPKGGGVSGAPMVNIKTNTIISEIHWRLQYDFIPSIIKHQCTKAYLNSEKQNINDAVSNYMSTTSNFHPGSSFLFDAYGALKGIDKRLSFNRTFLGYEFLNIDINTQPCPQSTIIGRSNKGRLAGGDYTEYLKFKVTTRKSSTQNLFSRNQVFYKNTCFFQFNLERFNQLKKSKSGSIYHYQVFFTLFFMFHADYAINNPFNHGDYYKEIVDFNSKITATQLTLKRHVTLKGISYFTLFTILQQNTSPTCTTKVNAEGLTLDILHDDLELKINSLPNNQVGFELTIRKHSGINSFFYTIKMNDILQKSNSDLNWIFDNIMRAIFIDNNGGLCVPTGDILSLEAKQEFFSKFRNQVDGLADFISVTTFHDNPRKIKANNRLRNLTRKALPKKAVKQEAERVRLCALKKDYCTILNRKKRVKYDQIVRAILGV